MCLLYLGLDNGPDHTAESPYNLKHILHCKSVNTDTQAVNWWYREINGLRGSPILLRQPRAVCDAFDSKYDLASENIEVNSSFDFLCFSVFCLINGLVLSIVENSYLLEFDTIKGFFLFPHQGKIPIPCLWHMQRQKVSICTTFWHWLTSPWQVYECNSTSMYYHLRYGHYQERRHA